MAARKRSSAIPSAGPASPRVEAGFEAGLDEDSSLAQPASIQDDHDGAWKEVLELYFPQMLALLAPDLHALIGWTMPVEFLDKELQAVLRAGTPTQGRRHADKLARVRLLDGEDALLLVHVEVQGRLSGRQALQIFCWRMLEYNVLFRHRERRKRKAQLPPSVYSLGILIDQSAHQRTEQDTTQLTDRLTYQDDFLPQQTRFSFPIVELESWRSRWDELDALAPTNPFAVLMMAQLQASAHPDKATRLAPLLDLTRRLYGYGYTRDQIGALLRLVEWIIHLPPALETDYLQAARQLEQEHTMSYVTIAERHGLAKGLAKGRIEGWAGGRIEGQAELLLGLIQRRFGPVPDDVTQRIQTAQTAQLQAWSLNVLDAVTLEDVFQD